MHIERRALILDWDGTVVDTHELNREALAAALGRYAVVGPTSAEWPRLSGLGGTDLIRQAAPSLDNESIEIVMTDWQNRILNESGKLPTNEVVLRLSMRARTSGVSVAVASGGAGRVVRAMIDRLGLETLFQVVVCREDVSRGKPAPDLFLEAARRLGSVPRNCLVIEDAAEGLAAARAAGMAVIQVDELGQVVDRVESWIAGRAEPPGNVSE